MAKREKKSELQQRVDKIVELEGQARKIQEQVEALCAKQTELYQSISVQKAAVQVLIGQ